MPLEALVFVLLFLALALGWWLGNKDRANSSKQPKSTGELSREYFIGLNYLLDEQPDAALDTFVKALEVNSDTLETHLALGKMFRDRGQSDKAVRVHQNLFARPSLTKEQTRSVQLELAKDFMAAGLLDRAERLLIELSRQNTSVTQTSQLLLVDLYEREKEWLKALNTLNAHLFKEAPQTRKAAAHYACELAIEAQNKGEISQARKLLKQALGYDAQCIRATLLVAQLELGNANPKATIKNLLRLPEQNTVFVPVMLPTLVGAYHLLGQPKQLQISLEKLLLDHPYTSVIINLSAVLKQQGLHEEALERVNKFLLHKSSLKGVDYLINLYLEQADGVERAHLLSLKNLTSQLLEQKPEYQCSKCGFASKQLYWHCPKCREWGDCKPIIGVEGE